MSLIILKKNQQQQNKTKQTNNQARQSIQNNIITWWLVPLGGLISKWSSQSSFSSLQLATDELLLQELCMDITDFHTLLGARKRPYISCCISQYRITAFVFVPCHVSDGKFVVKFRKNSWVSTKKDAILLLPSRKDLWNYRLKLELWEIQNGGKIFQTAGWRWKKNYYLFDLAGDDVKWKTISLFHVEYPEGNVTLFICKFVSPEDWKKWFV